MGRAVPAVVRAPLLAALEQLWELLAVNLAESDLRASLHEATGTVRIAVLQSAALALMPELLRTLAERHPRLRVTMTQRGPETALMETFGP